jgi:hypothetical protein
MMLTVLRDLMGRKMVERDRAMAEGRQPESTRPFHVMLDEFSQYVTDEIEPTVAQARSLGFAMTFATQSLVPARMDKEGRTFDVVLANTATKYLMLTDPSDARRLEPYFPPAHGHVGLRDSMRAIEARVGMLATLSRKAEIEPLEAEYADLMARAGEADATISRQPVPYDLTTLVPGRGYVFRSGRIEPFGSRDMGWLKEGAVTLNPGTVPASLADRRARIRTVEAQEPESAPDFADPEWDLKAPHADDASILQAAMGEDTVLRILSDLDSEPVDSGCTVDSVRRAVAACVMAASA